MKNTYKNLLPNDFLTACKQPDAIIIDVRTPAEYEAYHLPNAVNIDIKQLDFTEEIAQLNPQGAYYIYCRVGIRSANACAVMKQLGFMRVYNLKGGIEALQP